MKIPMVLTSHDQLGHTGLKTGFWLEEFAAPYSVFRDDGAGVALASPKGGRTANRSEKRFTRESDSRDGKVQSDSHAQEVPSRTFRLSSMKSESFDAVFNPGGHGPMWDLAEDADSIALMESFYNSGKPAAEVCHAPGAFIGRRTKVSPSYKASASPVLRMVRRRRFISPKGFRPSSRMN